MNTKTRFCGILLLLSLVIISCDSKDYKWDILGEDFEAPVLTDRNTVRFKVYSEQWAELRLKATGRMVIEWGDGKMTKVGYGEEEELPSHKYAQGTYRVRIWSEELTQLNIGSDAMACNDVQFGECPQLGGLYISGCRDLISLNVVNSPNLRTLMVMDNSGLESLDVSQCSNLEYLYIDSQPELTLLDVSHNPKLGLLDCCYCALSQLSLEKNSKLRSLSCSGNRLSVLDLSANKLLEVLSCEENLLTRLDLSSHTCLNSLFCDENRLELLAVSSDNQLRILSCTANRLERDALNTLFLNLRDYSGEEVYRAQIFLFDNPGEVSCNRGILEEKAWQVVEKKK